jgi:phage protein D
MPSGGAAGVAGFEINAGGAAVDPAVLDAVVELVVDSRLRVPDRLTIRFRDDAQAITAAGTFAVGTALRVRLAATQDAASSLVFDGQVTGLAPRFDATSATLTVLALDRGCLLQRAASTASYQDMSYGAIATQLAGGVGLGTGTIEDGLTLAFVQQANETDWDFLWRLAHDVGYEVKVSEQKLNFRPAGGPAGGSPVTLTLGEELRSFAPRVTGVGQVDTVTVRGWDRTAAQSTTASASPPAATDSTPGLSRSSLADALGSGGATIVDHPFLDTQHATSIATSAAAAIANAFVEGEGVAAGDPALQAGAKVVIAGVGSTFEGTYALSGVRHVIRAHSSYETRFFIDGREDRSLFGLTQSSARTGWGRRIVVGVVTNNDDPDTQGRVRVRYPALSDDAEGWWARVVAPGAGGARGLLTLPDVGDEVLVAFEHESEQHPYVLGSVFNGQALPGDLAQTDGSFGLFSEKKLVVTAGDAIAITGAKALTLTASGDALLTTDADGDGPPGQVSISSKGSLSLSSKQDASVAATTSLGLTAKTSITLDAGTTLEISGEGQVTIKAASIKLEATAVVQISAPQVMLG